MRQEKLKLLIVDDEPDNLDLLYRTFRRDFEVIRAESAIDALKALDEKGEVAIIISDQRMPDMLGTEFLSRTVERFPDTIRIVLTGYTDVEDLVDAINSGKVFKYITKPWKPNQLQVVVEQAAETYQILKQRTTDLRRALRRESSFNAITTAIRESLDYPNMLQTIAKAIGLTFDASCCILHPVEGEHLQSTSTLYAADHVSQANWQHDHMSDLVQKALHDGTARLKHHSPPQFVLPLRDQQELLAILSLHRQPNQPFWSDEDLDLIEVVTEQAALAISQAKLYHRTQKQAEQIQAELEVARQIQTNLLRQTLPYLENLRVQACCHPAREVGGDFFEVYQHPQGDLWLAVGDVSGKGVPAALFMASAISVLRRELSQDSPEPAEVMRNLNNILSEDLIGANCFITLVLARYTLATHQLVYANAGHIYPLVWSKHRIDAEAEPTYLKVRSIPLGILPDWNGNSGELTLHSGEVLLITSDGITEATIRPESTDRHSIELTGAMLQQAGLWKLLRQAGEYLDLAQLLAQIQAHNAIQEDDQTILSLEVL